MQRVLKNSESILEEIQCYKGAGKEIREAISAPTEECQRRAYLTVAPLVAKLKRFYEFSLELGEYFPPKEIYPLRKFNFLNKKSTGGSGDSTPALPSREVRGSILEPVPMEIF